jgi:hypothetical protein
VGPDDSSAVHFDQVPLDVEELRSFVMAVPRQLGLGVDVVSGLGAERPVNLTLRSEHGQKSKVQVQRVTALERLLGCLEPLSVQLLEEGGVRAHVLDHGLDHLPRPTDCRFVRFYATHHVLE